MKRPLLKAAILALSLTTGSISAAAYPDQPIRVVVPFPAGQGADILMRLVAEKLGSSMGTSIIVENKPGAGGVIGASTVSRLPADGYTLLVGSSGPLSIAPHISRAVPYDPTKDFTPIAQLAAVTQVMVVSGDSPLHTLADVLAKSRTAEGMPFASSGIGSTSHLVMEYFAQRSGATLSHVPYKGGPPAIIDVVAQRVPLMFDALPGVLSNIRSGKLRALAVSSADRSPFLPNVPTVAESGVEGFGTEGWIGLLAPAGLDPKIVMRLNTEINRILSDPSTQSRLNEMAFRPVTTSPEEFTRFIAAEFQLWGVVASTAGVKPE
ncbi:Bug family tripartite tricarboxylate transporter substrate binding protein [Achromobacter anxifer]|uniref:Bug family tripartite tricarboxylate transporter substrate binding protein n=1 Tax=Achromobacter anxifer TaxID=1287737 RepID=UPI0023FA462D|nr:tripartite tricarboxylate transporter substrate binding protein [Achromobacter anxifer]MDF8364739.1 tripartite tricarboxylate transporter substrate binding protein [Achromobacter anxifer]